MKNYCALLFTGLLFVQQIAYAESPVVAESLATADQAVALSTESTTATVLADHELPKLAVSWDCGACEHNEKVPPLIEKEYADYAAAHGYTVSESETADMVIAEYHQRPPAARAMLGAFAGKDKLTTRVTFRGNKFVAKDYNANAWFGMNDLCRSVAQKSAENISAKLRSK
jgi:hypothetical protein